MYLTVSSYPIVRTTFLGIFLKLVSQTPSNKTLRLFQSPPKSDSVPSVTWTKDGRPLKEAPMKVRTQAKGARLTLDVMECAAADAGQYAVTVAGEKGAEVKAAFSLNVH